MQEVDERGFARLLAPDLVARAADDPWGMARTLLGCEPHMIERQPIHAVANGRSYASSAKHTPLHTDSQLYCGLPPRLQVLFCVRPSEEGGETHLLDTWALVRRLQRDDPKLHEELHEIVRTIPFVFGDVRTPTIARHRGSWFFTHSPMTPSHVPLMRALEHQPIEVLSLRAGEVLIVDNHRMLHGRAAFGDERRRLERILVWLDVPRTIPDDLARYAREVRPERIEHGAAPSPTESERIAIVFEMLRGVPPGVLSMRRSIPEACLYRFRDELLADEEARSSMLARAHVRD